MDNIFKKNGLIEKIKERVGKKKSPEIFPNTPQHGYPTTEVSTPVHNDELTNESDEDSESNSQPENTNSEHVLVTQVSNRTFQSIHPTSKVTQEIKDFRREITFSDDLSSPRTVLPTMDKDLPKEIFAQNINELSENMRFSVNNKLYADVIFRVGPNMQIIHAHKIVLSSRSSYFHSLFSQKIDLVDKSTGMIKLDKTDILPEVFLKVLEYLYTGIARLKQDDVLDVLALSEEFGIPTLKEMCSEFIQESVDVENSCMLLEMSREFNCTSLTSFCLRFIDKNINRVLSTKGLIDLSEATLIQIISRDELELINEEEIDIFHACLRWAKNRYLGYTKDKNLSPETVNKELKDIAKNIILYCRFPLMNSEQISSIVEPTNFVDQDLLFEAYKYHLTHGQSNEGPRFQSRSGGKKKKKHEKSFVTTRSPLTPIKRDSIGKRQSSFVNSDENCESPVKKVHFEPIPFTQEETPKKKNNQDQLTSPQTVFSPTSIIYNI